MLARTGWQWGSHFSIQYHVLETCECSAVICSACVCSEWSVYNTQARQSHLNGEPNGTNAVIYISAAGFDVRPAVTGSTADALASPHSTLSQLTYCRLTKVQRTALA